MGYEVISGLIMFVTIFIIIWYVGELCSILGIVFGCISCSNSKKYVNTRGLGNFKSIKNYHTAATVFMIISCVIIALWLAFWIWVGIVSRQSQDIEATLESVTGMFTSSISMLAVHIGSVVAGSIAQVQYKKAKELNMDILSGKVAPPPPPVVMMPVYPANPYQQNGYYGQPNNPYQQNNGYYNQQNPYGQQNGYNGQYNPQQQSPYIPNMQGYQQPPQNNAYNGQGYSQPPQNSAFINGQSDTGSQFPDPTISPAVNQSTENGITANGSQNGNGSIPSDKTVVCSNCGETNSESSRFCTHCGQIMK